MNFVNRFKVFVLLLGDVVALYASLFAALILRYGSAFYEEFLRAHVGPFTIIFVPWLIIFYIAGLYDLRRLRNNLDFLKILGVSIAVNAGIAILLFYLIPGLGIAPKTNLIIFIILFIVIETVWRQVVNRVTPLGEAPNTVILAGEGATADHVVREIEANYHLGYKIAERIPESAVIASPDLLARAAEQYQANIVVVPRRFKQETKLTLALYALFGKGILVTDIASFYEAIMRKVPLADLEETWFLENIEATARFYEPLKRAAEFLEALVLGIILIPLEIVIGLIVKLTSRGSVIYKQTRVGQNGKLFTLYKFRTMRSDAERHGAQWAAQNASRVTFFGKLLRKTHLDELPQLMNIIRGELSFVGPRPERPEFVEKLKGEIPYYEVRLLVKPGVTGWAQVNYPADRTLDDVKQKLQYDIYYLKNRSFVLDVAIVLKTIKSIFVNPK